MEEFIADECNSLKYELVRDYFLLAGEDDPVPAVFGIWDNGTRATEIVNKYLIFV